MKYGIICLLSALVLFQAGIIFADDNDDSYWEENYLLEQDFGGTDFPPAGWTIQRTNTEQTWRRGHCYSTVGWCATIKGHHSGPSDERLISPVIECRKWNGLYYGLSGYKDDTHQDEFTEPLSIEVTFDLNSPEDADWTDISDKWGYSLEEDQFRISLRYDGNENSAKWAIEWIVVFTYGNCEPTSPPDNDSESDDSSSDNDPDDDSDDDDEGSACGCGISKNTSGALMTFIMAAVGFCALILSTRKSKDL